MLFDQNQTEFPSELHEYIWMLGRCIVPFEVSTAEITGKEILDGFRQVYDFTVELLTGMYKNPENYKLSIYEKDLLLLKSNPILLRSIAFFNGILPVCAKCADNNWIMKTDDFPKKQLKLFLDTMSLLAPMGICCENNDGTIKVSNKKYPKFPKYYFMLCEASAKRKTFVFEYIFSCDFRVINERYVRTVDDTMKIFSDNDKTYALEMHDYFASKKIKPQMKEFRLLKYEYQKQELLSIPCSIPLIFRVTLGKSPDDKHYKFIIDEIEKLPNKDELLTYIANNRKRCDICNGRKEVPCGGKDREFCWAFVLNISRKKDRSGFIDGNDIKMVKQILDLRIEAIDTLQP